MWLEEEIFFIRICKTIMLSIFLGESFFKWVWSIGKINAGHKFSCLPVYFGNNFSSHSSTQILHLKYVFFFSSWTLMTQDPPPLPLLDFPLYCQFSPPSFFCLLNINSRTRNSPFFPFLPFLSKSNFKILEIPCYLILKCLFKLFKVQSMHYRFEFLVLFKHNRKQSFMNMSKVKYELILP